MKIPKKESIRSLDAEIEDFTDFECLIDNGKLVHKDCGTAIKYSICNISIHEGDSCGDTGEVTTRKVPFCPECEGMPEALFACVHEPLPTFPQYKDILYIFTFLTKLNVFSFFIGGGIGALLMYLYLAFHR